MHISADIWKSLAGIAIFLLGMNFLEDGLRHLAGRRFKLFLRKQTTSNFKAVGGGAVVTAILQSSSIVNLMVLAFVGAGVIQMQSALALTLGANLGTTLTSWIIATIGFSFKLENFSLPVVAAAGILLTMINSETRAHHWCKLLLGLGLLFFGLSFIKDGIESMLRGIDLRILAEQPVIVYLFAGFIIAALIQSSSATVAIALSALHADAISLLSAMAIVLGSEAGTTLKLLLASVKGSADKRRVAFGNLLFNIIITVIMFVLLQPVRRLITVTLGINDDLIALVFFQSLVNVAAIILFFPFLGAIGRFLESRFAAREKQGLFISKVVGSDPELGLEALEKESYNLIHHALGFGAAAFNTDYDVPPEIRHRIFEKKHLREKYEYIKMLHGEMQRFASGLQGRFPDPAFAARMHQLISCSRNCMYAAKNVRDALHDIDLLRNSSNDAKYTFYTRHREKIKIFCARVSALLAEKDADSRFEELTAIYKEEQQGYTQSLQELYQEGMTRKVNQAELSTLINFNREMYTAVKSFIFALKDYLLSAEKADYFDDLPGFIR